MKSFYTLFVLIGLFHLFGCSEEKTPFLDCITPSFETENLDVKSELKRFEKTLINQKIIENNTAESYRILFSLVLSRKKEKDFGSIQFDYAAKELTYEPQYNNFQCHDILDKDLKKEYMRKGSSGSALIGKIDDSIPTERFFEEEMDIKYNAYMQIPLHHFEKKDNQFYILFKAYSFGYTNKELYQD
ncbi:MAG: hypothetical protein WBG90_14455 [Saonia sp.]